MARYTYNLNALIVLSTLIGLEVVRETLSVLGDVRTVGRVEVVGHAVVEREERGGGTDFSTHVADGRHARARQGLDTRTGVLNNSAGTTLDGEDASDLEDDIWAQVECLMLVNMIGSTHPWG